MVIALKKHEKDTLICAFLFTLNLESVLIIINLSAESCIYIYTLTTLAVFRYAFYNIYIATHRILWLY